jgi:hypothetical protein
MTGRTTHPDRLFHLVGAVCDEDASYDEIIELNSIVRRDREACGQYLAYCRMHSALRLELQASRATQAVCEKLIVGRIAVGLRENVAAGAPLDSAVRGFPVRLWHGTVGCLSSSWTTAYLIAAVILGLGLLVGAVTHVSEPGRAVATSSNPAARRFGGNTGPNTDSVGRITGMVDCQWVDPRTKAFNGSQVAHGSKYALSSGLMEITYESGAKVILQGPVAYEVEARNGGFMSRGTLTGRVTTEAARGLTIRTPTATVVDLGTEFGVIVDEQGQTTSHVFDGRIEFTTPAGGTGDRPQTIVLSKNESARTEKRSGLGGERKAVDVIRCTDVNPKVFPRRIAKEIQTLDLLDIVAGGDGKGHRRERGIDPTTGKQDLSFFPENRDGDRKYRRVGWQKLIDGVFVLDANAGSAVLDSAGHAYDFPSTCGTTHGSIWARSANTPSDGREQDVFYWVYSMGRCEYLMPKGAGLLGLYPNAGITFDLEAIRKTHPTMTPTRFRAVLGMANASHAYYPPQDLVEGYQLADAWIFTDGQLKYKRLKFRPSDGAKRVDIPIASTDRFLTLVSTDGGNSRCCDWVVYGDPVLEAALEDEGENEK